MDCRPGGQAESLWGEERRRILVRNTNTTPGVLEQECASARKEGSWTKIRVCGSAQAVDREGIRLREECVNGTGERAVVAVRGEKGVRKEAWMARCDFSSAIMRNDSKA
jgi:hypothetical protein